MKLNLSLFQKVSSFFSKLAKGGHGYSMNPLRDWTIGLCVAGGSFLVGIALIAFDFYAQIGAPEKTVSIDEKTIQYNEQDVKRLAEWYAENEQTFNTLRKKQTYRAPVLEVASTTQKEDVGVDPELPPDESGGQDIDPSASP